MLNETKVVEGGKEYYIFSVYNGDTYYYKDKDLNILHRENGPAIKYSNGSKFWYINGKRHREDGPAIEWMNGNKEWYKDGKRHRENGPAVEIAHSSLVFFINQYYLNNKKYKEEEYWAIIKLGAFV